jgi:hypothetical protein
MSRFLVSPVFSQEVLGRMSAVLEVPFGACVDICTLFGGRVGSSDAHDGVVKGSFREILTWAISILRMVFSAEPGCDIVMMDNSKGEKKGQRKECRRPLRVQVAVAVAVRAAGKERGEVRCPMFNVEWPMDERRWNPLGGSPTIGQMRINEIARYSTSRIFFKKIMNKNQKKWWNARGYLWRYGDSRSDVLQGFVRWP